MYLSTIDRPGASAGPVRSRWAAVGGNVVALGAVSLVTDVSAEMVTAVLPLYLMTGLQLGPAAYGLLDGLYLGSTGALRAQEREHHADQSRNRRNPGRRQ